MNPQHKAASHWSRRFLLLTAVVALLHYCLFMLVSVVLFNTIGEKLNFLTTAVLPFVVWVLGMPAQAIVHSDFIRQLGPIDFSLIWIVNSLVWGVLLGAVIKWIWRRRVKLI